MTAQALDWTRFLLTSPQPRQLVAAYEDAETWRRVAQRLDTLAKFHAAVRDCRVVTWKFSLLDHKGFLPLAVHDAETADVILVSTHGSAPLPLGVKLWIKRWCTAKSTDRGILVALLDRTFADHPSAQETLDYLEAAATDVDFNWVPRFCDASDPAVGPAPTPHPIGVTIR